MSDDDRDLELIRKALAGDKDARHDLMKQLIPAIHAGVGHALRRYVPASSWSRARLEVDDLCHEVLVALFERGGRRLLGWQPPKPGQLKSLPLCPYVRLLSWRFAVTFLRKRKNDWGKHESVDAKEETVIEERLAQQGGPEPTPEELAERHEILLAVHALLEAELGPTGREVLRLHFKEGLSPAVVAERLQITVNAVHVQITRILKRAAQVEGRLRGSKPGDD